MVTYLLDTYAWVEMFDKSQKGKKVRELLNSDVIWTADSTAGEITAWALRNNHDAGLFLRSVRQHSKMVDLNYNLWIEAAYIRSELRLERKNIGMLDTLLLAIQKLHNVVIVTGDPHFKGLKNVLFL